MKQKLRLGDSYALTKHKLKQLKIRYISLLAVATIMCLYAVKQVSAQQAEPAATAVTDIKPLKIGDTIPEILWNLPLQVVNHPEELDTVTLEKYRGKLIILDFWATWCSSCIAAMPKLSRLQTLFGDKVLILPVTYENVETIRGILKSNKTMRNTGLMTVVDDKHLQNWVSYKSIPHYVWIDHGGAVVAITSTQQVTESNIRKALAGKGDLLVEKLNIDKNHPLLLSDNLPDVRLLHYGIMWKGQHFGLTTTNTMRRQNGIVHGRSAVNIPLLAMFNAVARRLFIAKNLMYSRKHLLVESAKPEGLSYDLSTSGMALDAWMKDNLFSYDVIVPIDQASMLDNVILTTLNRFTDYHGTIEKRNIRCLVLRRIKTEGESAMSGFPPLTTNGNRPYSSLANALNHPKITHLPVVDESGFNGDFHISPSELRKLSISTIKEHLRTQGLELIVAERKIPMFVIRDDNQSSRPSSLSHHSN